MIEDAAVRRFRIANAADVVDPNDPLKTRPAEHVSEAAGRVVALEHERTLSARAEQYGGSAALAIGNSNGLAAHGSSYILSRSPVPYSEMARGSPCCLMYSASM